MHQFCHISVNQEEFATRKILSREVSCGRALSKDKRPKNSHRLCEF